MNQNNLHDCVRASMESFFRDLDGTEPANLHDMLVKAVERPLLEVVMEQAQHNQSRAAIWQDMQPMLAVGGPSALRAFVERVT